MLKKLIIVIFFCFNIIYAENIDKSEFVNDFFSVKLSEISQLKSENKDITKKVEEILRNNFDPEYFSKRVLGKYWRFASEVEKKEITELIYLKIKFTYLNIFNEYKKQKVDIKKTLLYLEDKQIYRTDIKIISNNNIDVLFFTELKDNNIIIKDLILEGISLQKSFNSAYKTILQKEGSKGLIKLLKEEIEKNV